MASSPGCFPRTPKPTLSGYLNSWLYATVGIPTEWLPSDNPWIEWSYNTGYATTNPMICRVPGPFFLQAVYNLSTHVLLTNSPDVMTSPPYPYVTDASGETYGYFSWYRKQNNVLSMTLGTVNSTSDNGTSVGLQLPKQAENLTIGQLQLQTTPYGRAYLGIAQSVGTNWGLS